MVKQWKQSFGGHIFFVMFVTVLSVVILLTSSIYFWFRAQAAEDIRAVQLQTLENIDSVFSSYMENYSLSAHEIYAAPAAALLFVRPETKFVMEFSNYVQTIVANNPAINFISLFDKTDYVFSRQPRPVSDKSRAALHQRIVNSGDTLTLFEGDSMVYDYSVRMICSVIGAMGSDHTWKNGCIVGINADTLSENILGDLDSTYILDPAGRVILSANPQLFGKELENYGLISAALGDNTVATATIGGNESLICSIMDSGKKYRVVSIAPTNRLFASMNHSMFFFFLLALGVLAAFFVITLLLSHKVSQPVNTLVTEIANISPSEGNTGREEMDMAHIALRKAMETMKALKLSHIKDQQIHYLFGFENSEPPEVLFPSAHGWVLAILQIERNEFISGISFDMASLVETISAFLCNALHLGDCAVLPTQKDSLVVVIPGSETKPLFARLQKSLAHLTGCRISISLSDQEEQGSLPQRFTVTGKRMHAKALRGTGSLITRTGENEKSQEPLPQSLSDQVLQAVKLGNEAQIRLAAAQLLDTAREYHYNTVLRQLSALCVNAFDSTAKRDEELQGDVYRALLDCSAPEQLSKVLCGYLFSAAAHLTAAQGIHQEALMKTALQYIHIHFTDGSISMKSVASEMHMSGSHFSHIFKETTGETFPAYINRLRLSRARELLLLEKSFTIEKIAESVGFYSASYFTAAFKKQYGISPSQARRYDTVRAQMPDTGKEESS